MKNNAFLFLIFSALIAFSLDAQEKEQTKIRVEYAGAFDVDEEKFPGAKIFSKDAKRRVKFVHEGAELICDRAVLYSQSNNLKAWGDIIFQQGDTIKQTSEFIQYNGNTKLAKSHGKVKLTTPEQTLETDTLYFDREREVAYYRSFGTVKDSANVLTSDKGRYFLAQKKYQFVSDVVITHPDYVLNSTQLDYYTDAGNAYLYGPSTITGEEYKIYCERGFFDTTNDNGYFIKNSKINYNNRIIEGDSLYFDNVKKFASATNNIQVTDTINNGIARGHYAEVFKEKDSVFITKRAVAINLVEKDSVYIHADTLMVTGKPDDRIIRGFYNAKMYKSDMSGKADSIHVSNRTGITQLIRDPILWSGESQMTGDTIYILSNLETEKLDSLKIINSAFIVQKDTLSDDAFNQVQGVNLYGKFIENALKYVDVVKNPEIVYYTREDDGELAGIDKTLCSTKINLVIAENQITDITFFTNVEGDVYPEADLPKNARKLTGFIWREDEWIRKKEDLFDEDDNNIKLVKIRGLEERVDIDLELPGEEDPEKETEKNLPKKKK